MNRKQLVVGGLLLLSCGCSSMSNTDAGLLGGGAIGAGIGTIAGAALGHPGAGAAIGAATGAVAGGAIGSAEDRAERRADARALAVANARPPMSIHDVTRLAQSHVTDEVIIQQIRETGSAYNLTANDIIWLKQQGVSDRVVMEMQNRHPPAVVATPVYTRQVYVVEPAPPPPVAVGFGFGYSSRGRCWR